MLGIALKMLVRLIAVRNVPSTIPDRFRDSVIQIKMHVVFVGLVLAEITSGIMAENVNK